MTTRATMPRVRARVSYLIERLEEDIEGALHGAILRAYKHSEKHAPDADMEARIVDEARDRIMGCIFAALDFHPEDVAPAYDYTADDDDLGVEIGGDDDD